MSLRKKAALLKRWANIALGKSAAAVKQGNGRYYSKDEIRGYYNDLTGKISSGTVVDDKNIPLTEIEGGTFVRFPIAIFQYGLAVYDTHLAGEGDLTVFRTISDWALSMQRDDGSWDAFGPLGSSRYTVSSMCQGEGASLLFRAAKEFGDKKYEEAAFKAIDFMLRPVNEGGTAVYEEGRLYLEEYPQKPRRSVMNGWIFSIFGLYDAKLIKPNRYTSVFNQTLDTLCRDIRLYDCGYWSLYDAQGKIASPAYHSLHIALLDVLYDLTGRKELQDAGSRFEAYSKKKSYRAKAILKKLRQKLTEKSDVITIR